MFLLLVFLVDINKINSCLIQDYRIGQAHLSTLYPKNKNGPSFMSNALVNLKKQNLWRRSCHNKKRIGSNISSTCNLCIKITPKTVKKNKTKSIMSTLHKKLKK